MEEAGDGGACVLVCAGVYGVGLEEWGCSWDSLGEPVRGCGGCLL